MGFQGEVLGVGELLERSLSAGEPDWRALYGHIGLVAVVDDVAAGCADLVEAGATLGDLWRFGVLQVLDHYLSARRRGGVELAREVFADEPRRTGAVELDAAFAALAEHLAVSDGWPVPVWAEDPTRGVDEWFPAHSPAFHAEARCESPAAFRRRGIFIGTNALDRA